MIHRPQQGWTLTDYQSFLQHPDPIIRGWAVDRIEDQYPQQAAESFVSLLTDSDSHLQISAARTVGERGDALFEPALLAAWPGQSPLVHNWLTLALGQLRSAAILPDLIALVEAVGDQPLVAGDELGWLPAHSAAAALGYYPDEPARAALWALLERYPVEDRLTYAVIEGLLRFARPPELARLVRRWGRLTPAESSWWRASRALAGAAKLAGLASQLLDPLPLAIDTVLEFLDFWFLQEVPLSDPFLDTLAESAGDGYAGLLPELQLELARVAAGRGDDVAGWVAVWSAGTRPTGYRWRMAYASELLAALAENPPSDPEMALPAVALGLALVAQAAVDQDDEAALRAAPNELFRQATLLSILSSPRPNVLPDIVDQTAALGPGVVPHLVEILEAGNIWAWLRALPALAHIARAEPGAADAAVPAILDLIHLEQGDELLEAASAALRAIGPGAIEAIAERLGQDYVYDIYAGSVLLEISDPAAVEAYLDYVSDQATLDEFGVEGLGQTGQLAALVYLRDHFEWRGDPLLCTALYKLAVVTGYGGRAELAHWRRIARKAYRAFAGERKARRSDPSASGSNPA